MAPSWSSRLNHPALEPPLEVLIFGYGLAGAWFHHPLISSIPELRVSAVVTSDPQRGALARSRGADVYTTVQEALEASDADIAVVAVPNRAHVELTVASLEAGMSVVVDKPLANQAADGQFLVEEAKRLGRSLTVFHNRRWDGDFLTICQLVRSGRLGAVHTMISRFDRWVPDPQPSWHDDEPADGGGVLLDLGSHLVDQAIQLFGQVDGVYAELRTLRPHRRAEDTMFLSLRHRSGQVSHLSAGSLEGEASPRFQVSGSLGAYVKRHKDIQEARLRDGAEVVPGKTGAEPSEMWGSIVRGDDRETVETVPGDWSRFYRELVDHLTADGPPPVSGEEAVEVLRILDAARISSQEGTVVPLRDDGENETQREA